MADEQAAPAAPEDKPGALLIAQMSWVILLEALRTMPMLFLSAMVCYAAVRASGTLWISAQLSEATLSRGVFASTETTLAFVAMFITQTVIEAAVAIPIHRLILRDEKQDAPVRLLSARTIHFAAWLLGVQLFIFDLPLFYAWATTTSPTLKAVLWTVLIAFGLGVGIFSVRVSLLFPALAIDAPSGGLRDRVSTALRLSRGRSWRIFGSGCLAVIPMVGVVIAVAVVELMLWAVGTAVAGDMTLESTALALELLQTIGKAVTSVLAIAVGAAVLSWNYRIALAESGAGAPPQ